MSNLIARCRFLKIVDVGDDRSRVWLTVMADTFGRWTWQASLLCLRSFWSSCHRLLSGFSSCSFDSRTTVQRRRYVCSQSFYQLYLCATETKTPPGGLSVHDRRSRFTAVARQRPADYRLCAAATRPCNSKLGCCFENIFADLTNGIYLLLHCAAWFPCFIPVWLSHDVQLHHESYAGLASPLCPCAP